MKIALKIHGTNRFAAYEVKDDLKLFIGQYAGAIATVKRMIEKKVETPVTIVKLLKPGWY